MDKMQLQNTQQFENILGEFDERINRKRKLEENMKTVGENINAKERSIKRLQSQAQALKDELAEVSAEESLFVEQIGLARHDIENDTNEKASLVLKLRNGKNMKLDSKLYIYNIFWL